jgi:DNA-binding protein H-NS
MATTLEAIQAKMDRLKAQADALIAKQSSGVVEKIRELMAEHGLTAADINAYAGGTQRARKVIAKTMSKGSAAAVKYRDPKTGATWSGHGRAPAWIASAKNRDKFLADVSVASASVAPASKARAAGNYARGPQPAVYRDPKTGATWSGRGRAPAWIAEAKNRDRFLISGTADATVAATASAAGVASKTKTVVKKVSKSIDATAGKGQRKGPQPALYRDLKTGATWSGRGRAPAWLAGAKDRTRVLIAGVSEVAESSVASKPKAVAKKRVTKTAVAKKVAAKKSVVAKKVVTKPSVAEAPEAAPAQATV